MNAFTRAPGSGRGVDLGCGIWPAVNPSPALVEALSHPGLAMQPAFARDFTRLPSMLVKGLLPRR